jgi:hypothetical protein
MATTRRVIILYDGTWCGREVNTRSNVYFLAEMIGINLTANPAVYTSTTGPDIRARYFDGVGLGGDFMSYLWNGAFATQAKRECSEVYDFIVQNFAWDDQVHTEVWMFGISRGAYIVRSVAGMINNCGLIIDGTNADLIGQIYDIYRNPHAVHWPWSDEMEQFRKRVSHRVRTPIKFMGIFDTVGSRGAPKLNYDTGTGFEWPGFHDSFISSVVEKVYHAVAIHDRFWAFQPCLAFRDNKHRTHSALKIYQKWFPGCHYDLARQEFQFLREQGSLLEKVVFPIVNLISKTVSPNHQLGDLVLIWMLSAIDSEGGGVIIQRDMNNNPRNITQVIDYFRQHITTSEIGNGDIYEHILSYLPGGWLFSTPVAWCKNHIRTTYAILFDPIDRVIPDLGIGNSLVRNEVYDYTIVDPDIPNTIIVTSAQVSPMRYPSRTYQNHLTYRAAVGR